MNDVKIIFTKTDDIHATLEFEGTPSQLEGGVVAIIVRFSEMQKMPLEDLFVKAAVSQRLQELPIMQKFAKFLENEHQTQSRAQASKPSPDVDEFLKKIFGGED